MTKQPGKKPQQAEQEAKHTTRGDERRQELVAAAYQIIAEKGFEGLRVRDVAAQAGVNIATLHYYFATKEALVRAVVDYLLHQFLTLNAPTNEEPTTPVQQLRQLFGDLAYQLQHMPDMFVVLTELHLHSRRDPAIHAMLQALTDGWREHIVQICQEGLRQRRFRPDLDAQLAASTVIALIKGMSLQAVSSLDTYDFDRVGDQLERWFVNSEKPKP